MRCRYIFVSSQHPVEAVPSFSRRRTALGRPRTCTVELSSGLLNQGHWMFLPTRVPGRSCILHCEGGRSSSQDPGNVLAEGLFAQIVPMYKRRSASTTQAYVSLPRSGRLRETVLAFRRSCLAPAVWTRPAPAVFFYLLPTSSPEARDKSRSSRSSLSSRAARAVAGAGVDLETYLPETFLRYRPRSPAG